MPIYEYECSKCHNRFERLQRFSDPPVSDCPACGGPVSQLVSAPAIQFKGTGWYVTDYAHKSSAPAASGNGKSSSSDGGGSTPAAAPAETKPASAPAAEK